MNGVSAMEINSIRPFLVEVMSIPCFSGSYPLSHTLPPPDQALGVFHAFNPSQGSGAGEGGASQPDSQGSASRRRFGEGEDAGGGRKLRRFR